ncbi:MAG: FecR domain-containing protein [Opitutaceae bacterium]|nr:FecR domain-containing protein [Opitutaceae bacterium]
MNNPSSAFPRDLGCRAIEERAAEWFGRVEIGLTTREEREFLEWLEADPRHGEAMREMDETWEHLDGLKEIRRWRRQVPAAVSRVRTVWFAPALIGAAALVALVFFVAPNVRTSASGEHYAVAAGGGMKKVELPDGSVVHLNASSRVSVRYSAAQRRVELQEGEAHFAVTKDARRPFVVVAGDVAVKAIGTAFNVRREPQGVAVFVTEGKVRLDDAGKGESLLPRASQARATPIAPGSGAEDELLVAGQRAVVPLSSASPSTPAAVTPVVVAPMAPAEMREALAWQGLQLEFDQMPLAQVVADFNRYNSHQLEIADPRLAQQTFGGSFRADNLQGFVQLLEERFGVEAERGRDKTVLRRRND